VRLKTAKQRTASSQRWLERQLNDPYVAAAKREGYRSRSAFKLIEIDDKHRLLRPGKRVVDLGAAPGGWAQVAAERVRSVEGKGQVVAIDLLAMEPIAGVAFLRLDFMDATAPAQAQVMLREAKADVVLSDMAAQGTATPAPTICASWAWPRQRPSSPARCSSPAEPSVQGVPGRRRARAAGKLKRAFTGVRHIKPPASRAESAELYVIATGFRGAEPTAP
jgi:23S rRNA (uridine2552-2'-O)-methyltransferase